MSTELKYRRNILIIDDGTIFRTLGETGMGEQLGKKGIALTMVSAKDGAQASLKARNQRFDAVVLDTAAPRLEESGFVNSFRSARNIQGGHLYAVSAEDPEDLSPSLKTGRVFAKPLDVQALASALILDLAGEDLVEGHRHAVDVRVINAIISSTLKVLGQFQVRDIVMGKPQPKSLEEPLAGVISSVLDIVSETFRGQLFISFDKGSFLEIVTNMLMEEQVEITAENQDAVGEINNIIYGNAKPDLSQFGVEMSIPKVIQNFGEKLIPPAGSAAMRVPFATAKGHFFIDVVAFPSPLHTPLHNHDS